MLDFRLQHTYLRPIMDQ